MSAAFCFRFTNIFKIFSSYLYWCLILGFFACSATSLKAAELMVNGSFEAGSFAGWTTTNASNPFISWNISGAGAGGGFIPVPVVTQPQDGTRVAWQGVACNAGSSFILSQDVALPAATTAQLRWRDRFQDNLFEFCGGSGEPVCGTVIYRVDVLTTGNVLLQNLRLVTALPNSNTDTGWHIYIANLSAFAGQTVRIRFMTTATVTWDGPGQLEVDAVSLQAPAVTTSASVPVSGRVTTADGQGISKALVSIADGAGHPLTTLTNAFGYYSFADVPTGVTYMISVSNKRYQFANPMRIMTIVDAVSDADFTAM